MKRNYFFLILLTVAFVQIKADIAPTVMLRHNGMTTFYQYNEVQQAINAAVNGDTIYLTEGTYQPFNINKRIMVRGVGETTMVNGNCEININGTSKLTMPVLDAISFNGNVVVNNAYKQFTLRKCKMSNLFFEGANHYDVKLTQCYITNALNLTNNVHEFNAFNTRIEMLCPMDYVGGQVTFDHCAIKDVADTIQSAVFNSSTISRCVKWVGANSTTNLIGCILNSCYYNRAEVNTDNCNFIDCTTCSISTTNGQAIPTDYYSTSKISALDGTPVGAYGGQLPYTQAPELPTVTRYQLAVDPATKKMRVNLTVTKP